MVKWKVALVAYCGVVLYLSSMSPGDMPDGPKMVSDKVLHFVEYAIMGVLAWAAFGRGGERILMGPLCLLRLLWDCRRVLAGLARSRPYP